MQILICGSRTWTDKHPIYLVLAGALAGFHTEEDPLILVHGDALGADSVARDQARLLGIEDLPFPAKWKEHGRAAGPIRNRQMLDENAITVVYAFRSTGESPGTDDMVAEARKRGVPTYVISNPGPL